MNKQSQNHFIIEFENELNKNETNNEYLINREIIQIELYVNTPQNRGRNLISLHDEIIITNSVFDLSHYSKTDLFNEIFNEYIIYGSAKKTKSRIQKHNENLYQLAVYFAEYYLWLKELQSNPLRKPKKSKLNHQQKMLALYYLGLDLRKFDDTKVGFVLSQILDLNEVNTRKFLPKLYFNSKGNDVRTEESFKKLSKLFENEQFEDISNKIKDDFNSLK